MSDRVENQFGQVAKHSAAQLLLTGCVSRSLSFVADLMQGRPTNCSGMASTAEKSIIENGILTSEQAAQLKSRCGECRQALNKAADAWKKRDRADLSTCLQEFRQAQGRMRGEIIAVVG